MALDNFESLPGIIHELQDGGLQIAEINDAPAVLVLGTATKGVAERKVSVVRANESQNQFGTQGTLVRGMYEALAGGAQNVKLMRVGAKSASVFGIGTDDQSLNPTVLETLIKDDSAGELYFVKYVSPGSIGGGAEFGHLKIKNINGVVVFDSNPGGEQIETGEVFFSGELTGGDDIGDPNDAEDYVKMSDLAGDYDFIAGKDGAFISKMELYQALDAAYQSLESDEIDVVIPRGVFLDDKNIADGDVVILSSDSSIPAGQKYPVAGSAGDALGKLYKEEFEGQTYYFWNTNASTPGVAGIYPLVGAASATTKIDGSALSASDFKEVNFAYQLANFCFSISVNDNEATGVIGTKNPKSFSAKDVSSWIGKEPVKDASGQIIINGSGLLGNKFMVGSTERDRGFIATFSGNLPIGANFQANADVIKDRNGALVDIGKYISVCAMPLTFFNSTDLTGAGYQSTMASMYGGFYSSLPSNSSPTNKTISGVRAPFRISKTKLNSLAKAHYVSVKQKEETLKISDAPTAARPESDFVRLTTVRIVSEAVNVVRTVAEPYIGEPNTAAARVALETGIVRELARLQELGFVQRFEAKVTATVAQQIQGDATVELVIVPAFELRKITIITSLAKQ